MALEISVWQQEIGQKQTANQNQPQINLLAETVIPLESAVYSSNSEWWPLNSTVNQQQIDTQTNLNTNFAPIAQSTKQQLLTTTQLQDRCVSAEYLG